MKQTHTIAAAILLLATGFVSAAEKIDLKWKPAPGDYVITVDTNTDMEIKAPDMPQPMGQQQKQLMVFEMKVDKPTETGQRFHIIYKRVKMVAGSNGMTMAYDSADKSTHDSPMAAVFSAMLDLQLGFTVDKAGQITDIAGVDEMWDRVAKASPMMAQMAGQMKEQFGAKMFEQMLIQRNMLLPPGPVAKGDTWPVKLDMELPMIGAMAVNMTGRLKEAASDKAMIEYEGRMSSKDGDKTTEVMGAKMKFKKLELEMKGTSTVSTTLHMVVLDESKMNGDIVMTINPPPGNEGPQQMEMAIKLKTTAKTQVTSGKYQPASTSPATTKPSKP